MTPERVVSNSSPLMNLAIIGHLNLLQELFVHITVPQEVFRELTVEGAGKPGADLVTHAKWIHVASVSNRELCHALNRELDLGESAAIALALEQGADLVLLDETDARNVAEFHGLRKTGVLGILMRAKSRQLISEIRPLMERLRDEAHFWIKPALYDRILAEANEH